MKIDFWQVTDDPVEKVVTLIARRALGEGERVLVVSDNLQQREAIARALWQAGPESFLANGEAGTPGAEAQPILLSAEPVAANDASHLILADGHFRDSEGFARVFLLFPPDGAPAARQAWRALDGREGVTRSYFAQEEGRWVKKG
ncbi:MAG: DNA polymerase III subunit chi [Erythrobacter sp.]|jgi:DNA polymerase-3 subunit chi|uniref:DNA polymerase III subunit chi n=1 Tax=Erythrobacter sp. TaxID=1042 RepID=UPI002B4A3174|nr:DNA polymerase III subunit chi [Erythrobacter sp.]WRH71514.1 MAG: DNA polymerase III subunit chi [Erythrobacter sp.]